MPTSVIQYYQSGLVYLSCMYTSLILLAHFFTFPLSFIACRFHERYVCTLHSASYLCYLLIFDSILSLRVVTICVICFMLDHPQLLIVYTNTLQLHIINLSFRWTNRIIYNYYVSCLYRHYVCVLHALCFMFVPSLCTLRFIVCVVTCIMCHCLLLLVYVSVSYLYLQYCWISLIFEITLT